MSVSQNSDPFEKFNHYWNLQLPLVLLIEALTHPSYKSVDPNAQDNQRLETLGDSVIDLLVLEWLYHKNVMTEGILTKKRAEIVQNTTLAEIGKDLQIGLILRCAPAYTLQEKDIADTVEAIFGALYVANGLDSCQSLLLRLFGDLLNCVLINDEISSSSPDFNEHNPKNQLQEFFQQRHLPGPVYQLLKREGTVHDPQYWYLCQGRYQDKALEGKGSGRSKKEAQKKAALDLYQKLLQLENQETLD
ncbi:MAG: ribonuclease III family protein [Candidatus Hodarchaeota archaeon]